MPRAGGSSTVLGAAVATAARPPDAPRQRPSDAALGSRSAEQSISTAPIVDLASFVATYTAAQSSASAARGSAPETPVTATAAATSDRTNANATGAPPSPPTGIQVPNGQVVVPRGSSRSSSSTQQRRSQIAPIEGGARVPTEENNNLRSASASAVDAGGDRHSTPSATHEHESEDGETKLVRGRPVLPREEMLARRRARNKQSAQNSRQKRKEEYDYLQANLDRKDTEIEQLQKRCTHLEQYVRKLQSALSDGGLQVPKEPHFGHTPLPAPPTPPAPGPQKLAKQQAAQLVADTVAAASAIPGVRQIRPLASGSSRPAAQAAPSPGIRPLASPTGALPPPRQPMLLYRPETLHVAATGGGDTAHGSSAERRTTDIPEPRLATLVGNGASSPAFLADRGTTPRSAAPGPVPHTVDSIPLHGQPTAKRKSRPTPQVRLVSTLPSTRRDLDLPPNMALMPQYHNQPGPSRPLEPSGSGRGRRDIIDHGYPGDRRVSQRPRPTSLEAIVRPTSPAPLPSMLHDAPPRSPRRSTHPSGARGLQRSAEHEHQQNGVPGGMRKLWQSGTAERQPPPHTYAYQQQSEAARSSAGFHSNVPNVPPVPPPGEARFVPFVFNRTRSSGSEREAERRPMSEDESGYDDYDGYDGYDGNGGYDRNDISDPARARYVHRVHEKPFLPDMVAQEPFPDAEPSSFLSATHLFPGGGVFSAGDDLDALSISALFNIEDWGGDDNDDEFVPPSSPPKEDDSDFEDATPGVRSKRRRLNDEHAGDNEDDDNEDDDDDDYDDDDMNIAEDEEEDLFQPIEDVPVPMEQLYQDAMDALGVSSRAELATVVAKIVETANKSGGPTTEQVEGLRRLALLAEAQGFYNSTSDNNHSRDDRSQS